SFILCDNCNRTCRSTRGTMTNESERVLILLAHFEETWLREICVLNTFFLPVVGIKNCNFFYLITKLWPNHIKLVIVITYNLHIRGFGDDIYHAIIAALLHRWGEEQSILFACARQYDEG